MKKKKQFILCCVFIAFAAVMQTMFFVISRTKGTAYDPGQPDYLVIKKIRYPMAVMQAGSNHREIKLANMPVVKTINKKLQECTVNGVEDSDNNILDVIIGLPQEKCKYGILSDIYKNEPIDWYVVFNGELYTVFDWKYDEQQEIQTVVSGPGWSVYVTRWSLPKDEIDPPNRPDIIMKAIIADFRKSRVIYERYGDETEGFFYVEYGIANQSITREKAMEMIRKTGNSPEVIMKLIERDVKIKQE